MAHRVRKYVPCGTPTPLRSPPLAPEPGRIAIGERLVLMPIGEDDLERSSILDVVSHHVDPGSGLAPTTSSC